MNKNSIQVIHPYLDRGTMVFDDPAVGLVKEAFVAVTLEIVLIPLDMQLSRKLNDDIGLKLLDL